jgi:hypothetical protein
VSVGVLAVAAIASGRETVAPGTVHEAAEASVAPEQPTEEALRLRGELERLADSWALGGGQFGFPFWEKAGRRWAAGQVTTSMYREYVTGYRDRLKDGCPLVESTKVASDVAKDVRSLAVDACRKRLDALRSQQRWLDALVELAAPLPAPLEPSARDERAASLRARAAEHEQAWRVAIQVSYRDARLATSMAQSELDSAGVDRIAEDAFV